ncbi:MAG: glycosyltransferase family 2 protein [Candidatus Margulisbacteria bacterium]|nr:glycosyltransferase family 2 protein [Candidatus Margulisiibacteriota bacterium]
MLVSVCIPVYNGAISISRLVDNVRSELKSFGYNVEFILVDDCSKDNSVALCTELAINNKDVKFIALRKNSGEHNAVMCALNYMTGDYAVIIDDDFQNPPSEIKKLLDEIQKGYDVVYSKYEKKKHSLFRNFGSRFNDIVATYLINKPKDLYLSSFKVIEKGLVEEIIKYKGPFPYIDGLILRSTSNYSAVYVEHNKREEGRSNYTLSKLVSLWLNMFINFSVIPLRIFTLLGIIVAFISFVFAIMFLVEKLMIPDTPVGWSSIIVSILFFSGIQLVFLGLIGEYLGKLYLDHTGKPQWTVKKEII